MSVISFEDWKQKKARSSALTSRGALREDVALQEAYGFDLCMYIAEERSQLHPDSARLDQLWVDLGKLMEQLPKEHGYFYMCAFEAFQKEDLAGFLQQFALYLDSEKRIFKEVADCDWWIDCLVWVFTPPLEGMYGRLADLFFRQWPDCAMGWVCLALEQGGLDGSGAELSLSLLHLALVQDPNCYLAHYLIASIYYEQGLWQSALPYFEKASASAMYKEDAAFYFDYAWACEKAGKLDRAADFYRSVLALDDSYPSALNNLGCVQMHQAKYGEALASFNQAIAAKRDGTLPYRNAVAALERMGRHEEANAFIREHKDELGPQYMAALEVAENLDDLAALRELMGMSSADEADEDDALKRVLEDVLESRIVQGERVFDRTLEMVEDDGGYGRAYYVLQGGCVDLLTRDVKKGDYVLVDVVPGQADERHLILLWQKMESVAARAEGAGVEGVLLCGGASKSLQARAKQIAGLRIELYDYHLALSRLK